MAPPKFFSRRRAQAQPAEESGVQAGKLPWEDSANSANLELPPGRVRHAATADRPAFAAPVERPSFLPEPEAQVEAEGAEDEAFEVEGLTHDEAPSLTTPEPAAALAESPEPGPVVVDDVVSEIPEAADSSPEAAAPSISPYASERAGHLGSLARSNPLDQAVKDWRTYLTDDGGSSALFDVSKLSGALLDLSRAHPSGIAQFYAGRSTRLSSLVREEVALAEAREGARSMLQHADELAQRYSSAPIYLVIGLARWLEVTDGRPEETRHAHAPILLRPLRLRVVGGGEADYELTLEPGVEINPELARALSRDHPDLNLADLVALSLTEHGFSPRPTLERIAELGAALPDFEISDQLQAGPFVHPSQLLLADIDATLPLFNESPVVRALAGDIEAKRSLYIPLPPPVTADRDPDAERGVGDLDPIQHSAVEQVASQRHLILDARAGTSVYTVLAAILADAAASGRSVVHMPATRRAGKAVVKALGDAGVDELVLDLQSPDWRFTAGERIREGLAPREDTVDDEAVRRVRNELREVRAKLERYMGALHRSRQPWQASAYDALQHLAELTTSAAGPATGVRLSAEAIGKLDQTTRGEAGERLQRFAVLGGFATQRRYSPWFGSKVRSQAEATDALERSQILAEVVIPKILSEAGRVARETGLDRAGSLAAWNEQLNMLDGIRESLDVFQPIIFERSASDMVIATATPAWRAEHQLEMSGRDRRRLIKAAKDLQRPGITIADLHGALVKVQRQRELWRQLGPSGGWPHVPQGLGDVRRTAGDATERLNSLLEVFPNHELRSMPLEELRDFLLELGSDPAILRYVPELNAIDVQLTNLGLGELVEDLRARQVDADSVVAELELCWWASVLETILQSDPELAQQDGDSLNTLAESFRKLDRAHVESLPGPVRRAVNRRRGRRISENKEAARELWIALSQPGPIDLASFRDRFGDLMLAARPIWIVPPMVAGSALPPAADIDLLVIDGAGHVPAAHVVSAMARARQVVLVGDTSRPGAGIIDELAGTLPAISLPTDRFRREEHLASFLAASGWEGAADTLPAPPSPAAVRLHVVEGFGLPAPGSVSVEGVAAEIEKVLELARGHLAAGRSVGVVSLSQIAAARIREQASRHHETRLALESERLTVVDVEAAAGLDRDAVILSVGFGKTPHGRVLHRFGPISAPEGLALMIDVIDAVVKEFDIVSCLAPEEIQRDRLHHPGAELLADLLEFASDRPAEPGSTKARSQPDVGEPDRLLVDLAGRLESHGLTSATRYGFEGGVRIPLAVGHSQRPGELFVAVLTDDDSFVAEPSLRRRHRHWVEGLEYHGWASHMAFSQAVFVDPAREAQVIAAKVRAAMAESDWANEAEAMLAEPRADDSSGEAGATNGLPSEDVSAAGGDEAAEHNAVRGRSRGAADTGPEPLDFDVAARGPRPEVTRGLPIKEYSDDQLDALVSWINADGIKRDVEETIDELRRALGLSRRGSRIDQVLRAAVERHG